MPKCNNAQCRSDALEGKQFCLTHHKEQDGYSYGLDFDVQQKLLEKQKGMAGKEKAVQQWIEGVVGEKLQGSLMEGLKTGVVLCKLINKFMPNAVPKINMGKMPFSHRENIANYLAAARNYGLKEHDLFVTVDLYEGKMPVTVVDSLLQLAYLATKKSPNVRPHIQGYLDGQAVGGVDEYVPPVDREQQQARAKPAAAAAPAPKPAAAAPADGPKFCPQCGEKRDSGAKFCGSCGNRF